MRVAGIILCALAFVAILPALPSMAKAGEGGVNWEASLDAGRAAARAKGVKTFPFPHSARSGRVPRSARSRLGAPLTDAHVSSGRS